MEDIIQNLKILFLLLVVKKLVLKYMKTFIFFFFFFYDLVNESKNGKTRFFAKNLFLKNKKMYKLKLDDNNAEWELLDKENDINMYGFGYFMLKDRYCMMLGGSENLLRYFQTFLKI